MRTKMLAVFVEIVAKFDELINLSFGGDLFDLDSHFR